VKGESDRENYRAGNKQPDKRVKAQFRKNKIRYESAKHYEFAVRDIQDARNAVLRIQAQSNQRVNASQDASVD
jgi:hypothetical protein